MDNKVKGLIIGIIVLALVLGSIVFLLRDQLYSQLYSEVVDVVTPWGGCLEKFDIMRDSGFATFSGGRMSEYQGEAYVEFSKQYCKYYVFRWMPEGYPERSFVEQAWYHEFRTDLTEEQKQKLRDTGNWPD